MLFYNKTRFAKKRNVPLQLNIHDHLVMGAVIYNYLRNVLENKQGVIQQRSGLRININDEDVETRRTTF